MNNAHTGQVRNRSGIGDLARVALLLTLAAAVPACMTAVPGAPTSAEVVVTKSDLEPGSGVDPSIVHNTDGGEIDRLAATVVTDLSAYWQEAFPATFGSPWRELSGGYYSVDTADANTRPPPCVQRAVDVEGNAFYCPSGDVIAWDRAALLPVLRERFGEAAVMLVLAHEMGHAVQRRAGLTLEKQRRNSDRYPTILVEAMADCYAGTFVRWVADGKAAHLKVEKNRLDSALESLIAFRDPIGTEQADQNAHGDAFDRVSAFQDGYDNNAGLCAAMTVDNRRFTQRGFLDHNDAQRGGNLPFDQLLQSMTDDLNSYFGTLVSERGKQWTTPALRTSESAPGCTTGDQGPVVFCPDGTAITVVAKGPLLELHADIGDYATGTILASRFGMAAMSTLGKPLDGADAQRQMICLAGSYTGMLLGRERGFTLSPGDLDEAIQVLLRHNYAGRDSAGQAIEAGFDRVSVFRAGTLQGVQTCGLA
jgi:predicted metalloprotease